MLSLSLRPLLVEHGLLAVFVLVSLLNHFLIFLILSTCVYLKDGFVFFFFFLGVYRKQEWASCASYNY